MSTSNNNNNINNSNNTNVDQTLINQSPTKMSTTTKTNNSQQKLLNKTSNALMTSALNTQVNYFNIFNY